jgi:hypothetical protein
MTLTIFAMVSGAMDTTSWLSALLIVSSDRPVFLVESACERPANRLEVGLRLLMSVYSLYGARLFVSRGDTPLNEHYDLILKFRI